MIERQGKTAEEDRKEMKGVRKGDTERGQSRQRGRDRAEGKGAGSQTCRNSGLLRPVVSLHSPSRAPPPHHPIKAVAGRAFAASRFLE